jgi:hypothetical protein
VRERNSIREDDVDRESYRNAKQRPYLKPQSLKDAIQGS